MKTVMHLKIPVSIFKEDKTFIAYSPVLDLSTSGKTFEQVQQRFTEVVRIFFEELVAMGTLDEVLANLGWRRVNREWNPPISVTHQLTDITIPLHH